MNFLMFKKTGEHISNAISTFAPKYFAIGWTVGWETGRNIVNTSTYQCFKSNVLHSVGIDYQIPNQFRHSILSD